MVEETTPETLKKCPPFQRILDVYHLFSFYVMKHVAKYVQKILDLEAYLGFYPSPKRANFFQQLSRILFQTGFFICLVLGRFSKSK